MSTPALPSPTGFDDYAENYDAALDRGLSVSGEGKDYFAQERVTWLARKLAQLGAQPSQILDFGCGTGTATPHLLGLNERVAVTGVEISAKSLLVARQEHGSPRARFVALAEYQPAGHVDLAFCNGVFHHIPLAERAEAVDLVFRALRPGGLFAFWENNPWNPGTRYVMSRIPFDRDAITLSVREAKRLLVTGGFTVVRTDFLFWFPRALRWLRGLEPLLTQVPLGAQYLVLCRKP